MRDVKAILREDRKRRNARLQIEDASLAQATARASGLSEPSDPEYSQVRGAIAQPELVRGIGVTSPPLSARVTRRYAMRAGTGHWHDVTVRDAHKPAMLLRQMGTVGVAPGTTPADGVATVKVTHADGTTEIRTAASYRKRNSHTRTRATQVAAPHRITAADLAPIGDQNH